jgi:predicted NAD-dependent protein-ADP-ribosyltransferase YbiA (DUF1768 family)
MKRTQQGTSAKSYMMKRFCTTQELLLSTADIVRSEDENNVTDAWGIGKLFRYY